MAITNEKILTHEWLQDMRGDDYYPGFLVDKLEQILLEVCENIEKDLHPGDLDWLYRVTNAGVVKINDLAEEFDENNSEIETVARDAIGVDFEFIALSYGFDDADVEELIAERDW